MPYTSKVASDAVASPDNKTEARLVTILYGDGTPYKEDKVLEYTDISDKKQIEMMAEMGIGLEGPKRLPASYFPSFRGVSVLRKNFAKQRRRDRKKNPE